MFVLVKKLKQPLLTVWTLVSGNTGKAYTEQWKEHIVNIDIYIDLKSK